MSITVLDPVAQTFIIDKESYPEGVFLSSINLFFRTKPTENVPIKLSIVSTFNGYPTGRALDYSTVTLYPGEVRVSENPQYIDASTYTKFSFSVPVYINPDTLYAIIVQSNTSGYKLWAASQNDLPIPSSVKELPSSPTPTQLTRIAKSPYVGSFFESQNGITYTADQTKDLMFTISRCIFDTSVSPSITYVIPQGLPRTKLIERTLSQESSNISFDEMNISTTDFKPTGTAIFYNYTATLDSTGASEGPFQVNPGNFGTPSPTNIYLNDNKGKRVLVANSNSSFSVTATLNSVKNELSPMLADDGLRLYTVKYSINNMGLSNSVISLVNGGEGYLANANGTISSPNITVSAPDEIDGVQAYVSANVVLGNITSIFVTTEGSGYTKTPTISILGANTVQASAIVSGETSATGGNGLARYQTYPVTLAQGNDSGDLRVYFTAYRPIGTNIHIYYKILSREDTQDFNDSLWQKMTLVQSTNRFSLNRNDLYEYVAAPGTGGIEDNFVTYTSSESGISYNTFYKYAIKVVLSSSDSTFTPFLKDIRVIALPSGRIL